jgi:PhoH-like ATPase
MTARLYQPYSYDQTPGGSPIWSAAFNGNDITPEAVYKDRKGFGTYDYPYGLYVYNVTGGFSTTGNTLVLTNGSTNNNSLYGSYLVVVYRNASDTQKTIYFNEEADLLIGKSTYAVTGEEATAYAPFNSVDTTGMTGAKVIAIATGAGKAGTGKTLLAMAAGLQKVVDDSKYSRLVISRPISPMGKDLGYLPGSKSEKFNPWMQPIYDNMDILLSLHDDKSGEIGKNKKKASMNDFMDYGFIELEPLTYIRGRSLPNQFIIIDESQNLSRNEMKTIITRAGKGTKLVLTGDPYQIDIPYLDAQSNGLSVAVEKLKNEVLVGHMTLDKGERSALADLAAKYFQ